MMVKRRLFCEVSPLMYEVSVLKNRVFREVSNFKNNANFAQVKNHERLPFLVYEHKSLIRRTLGNVDKQLQENKATNLSIAAPKIDKILIKPGEVFSFWKLVGKCTKSLGYKDGLTISKQATSKAIGGGMCQFTNLIHWLILHSDMQIVEHHHHDQFDLFPDFNRQVPFGTGTSIFYNYLDYRFVNTTNRVYQLITYTTETHLCGELRSDEEQCYKYHLFVENEFFTKKGDIVYRNGQVYRKKVDPQTGKTLITELIKTNYAKVMYDTSGLEIKVE